MEFAGKGFRKGLKVGVTAGAIVEAIAWEALNSSRLDAGEVDQAKDEAQRRARTLDFGGISFEFQERSNVYEFNEEGENTEYARAVVIVRQEGEPTQSFDIKYNPRPDMLLSQKFPNLARPKPVGGNGND